jgi:hypothetical protein
VLGLVLKHPTLKPLVKFPLALPLRSNLVLPALVRIPMRTTSTVHRRQVRGVVQVVQGLDPGLDPGQASAGCRSLLTKPPQDGSLRAVSPPLNLARGTTSPTLPPIQDLAPQAKIKISPPAQIQRRQYRKTPSRPRLGLAPTRARQLLHSLLLKRRLNLNL